MSETQLTCDGYIKEIIKSIMKLSNRHGTHSVFEDFLELSAISLSNSVDLKHYEEREKRYMEIIGGYTKEEVNIFPEILGSLVMALERAQRPTDILGRVYHELELHNKYRGQFFTPQIVCDAMGAMVGGQDKTIKEKGFIRICEPCIGSGAMVLGYAHQMQLGGYNYQQQMVVYATDIDLKCVHMAYIQLSLLHIPAVITHGDSLLMKFYSQWHTPAYILGGWQWKKQQSSQISETEKTERNIKMEKVKFMKITRVIMNNFRSYKNETSIDMGDMTMISGCNGKGKSSIAHAIAYAFHGVSAFGVQDIDNIRADENVPVKVTIEFIDQNGELHSFNRTRTGDSTALVLDGHKILQKNIDDMFCDKDTLLSLFNPSYFIEVMGGKGKEFLSLRLPNVKPDEVFAKLTAHECKTLEDIDLTVPDEVLQSLRRKNKDNKEALLTTEGQLEQIGDDIRGGKAKLAECHGENSGLEQKIAELTEKKFTEINSDELIAEKYIIQDKLGGSDVNAEKRTEIENLLIKWDIMDYQPKRVTQIAEIKAELNSLSLEYSEVKGKLDNLNLGDTCPSCLTEITEANIEAIRQNLNIRFMEVCKKGKDAKERLKAEESAEAQEKAAFEKERDDEKQGLYEALSKLGDGEPADKRALTARLNEIDELLRVGNLTEDEHSELCDSEAILTTNKSLIKAIDIEAKEAKFIELTDTKAILTEETAQNAEKIKAMQEYIAKRSEIALSGLQRMPGTNTGGYLCNVQIQFYETVQTTGELKSCFKFTYKGHEYCTLSLSEKIKVGIEVAAMLRGITGFNYPLFIDNSESIGGFDNSLLPNQTIFMKFVKGTEISVRFQDTQKQQEALAA